MLLTSFVLHEDSFEVRLQLSASIVRQRVSAAPADTGTLKMYLSFNFFRKGCLDFVQNHQCVAIVIKRDSRCLLNLLNRLIK